MPDYDGQERRAVPDESTWVKTIVRLAVLELSDEVKTVMRDEVAKIRADFERNYQTVTTCAATHRGLPKDMATEAGVDAAAQRASAYTDAVDKRVTELRGWVWGAVIAALLAIVGVLVQLALK
jgi:hypothetical protein